MRPHLEQAAAEIEPPERASDGRSGTLRLVIIVLVLAFVGILGFAFSKSGGGPSMAVAESGGAGASDIPIMHLNGGQSKAPSVSAAPEPSAAPVVTPAIEPPATQGAGQEALKEAPAPGAGDKAGNGPVVVAARSWEVRTLPQSTQVDGLLNQIHRGRKTSGSPFRTIVNSTTSAAIERTIDALRSSGVVTDGPAPRVVIRSGENAQVEVTEAVESVDGYVSTRQMITIELTPKIIDDEQIRLDTNVIAATATSRTTVALQDIGIPVGTTNVAAAGAVLGPHDALLIWVPQRDHGVLVELKAEATD